MPDEPEALGLLALMLFHDARSAARRRRRRRPRRAERAGPLAVGCGGHRGRASAAATRPPGWAAPARSRSRPPSRPATSGTGRRRTGRRSPALYDHLFALTPSAVIALNRAVAVSMSEGPEAGLALLDRIASDGELRAYHLLPAARGGHAASSGPPCRGRRGVPPGLRPGGDRRRAPLPGAPPARGHRLTSASPGAPCWRGGDAAASV